MQIKYGVPLTLKGYDLTLQAQKGIFVNKFKNNRGTIINSYKNNYLNIYKQL